MSFDPYQYRKALGHFATGVTIVTTKSNAGSLFGFTANSFSSVSLDPPLVLFSLDRKAQCLSAFEQSGSFAINILGAGHQQISTNFAAMESNKRWHGIEYDSWETGAPMLKEAIARFDCRTHAIHDGGDHRIFLGEVLRFDMKEEEKPLIYFRSQYSEIKT